MSLLTCAALASISLVLAQSNGCGGPTGPATGSPGVVAPNQVRARQGQTAGLAGGILVEWSIQSSNQDSFLVYRAVPGGQFMGPINPAHHIEHRFWDTQVQRGQLYIYKVQTVFNGQTSALSPTQGECVAP